MAKKRPEMSEAFKAELQNIGLNVKAFRQEKNLKQSELGELVELAANFIYLIEAGREPPNLQRLSMMADVLDKDLADFFKPAAEGNTKRVRHAESSPQDERPEPAPP